MRIATKIQIFCLSSLLINVQFSESKMSLEQVKNSLKPLKNSCLKKVNGIDVEIVDKTKAGEFPPDQALKCFFRCILQLMKIMKSGELLLPVIITQVDLLMPEEYVEEMKANANACFEESQLGEDPCEKSYLFIKCLYGKNPQLYFFP